MSTTVHQQIINAYDLASWEPLNGHAVASCKIRGWPYDT